ncbi:hypothetical protein BS47DRAFT_546666 [Hydnum rufescens UP504]|uniref:Uncharacterized protein n=1 Tax=Hydnum rufescens UP504 TaxID=1448309 RepID=A0A9P6B446_9AGAM|nr:hypothetical protein BS47DRAFT_546666 [Hydnum rufescens UP504]
MMTVGDLVAKLGAKLDGFNLLEVVAYLHESKLARKISGYCDQVLVQKIAQDRKTASSSIPKQRSPTSPPLHAVEAFLVTLVDANDQGRIFIERFGEGEATNVVLKYQLLNPEHAFKQVVEDARAVVLAGGTMTPMSDFRAQLFQHLPETRIATFSCGHVIHQIIFKHLF